MLESTATYSDGQSAAASTAHARLRASGVEITLPGGQTLMWPYEEIFSAAPVLAGQPVNIGLISQHAARLHVEDPRFADALLLRAPQLGVRHRRRRLLRPMLAAAALIAAFAAIVTFTDFSPARIIASHIPHSVRARFGDQLIASMTKGGKTCANPKGMRALKKLVLRLNPHDEHGAFSVRVAKLGMLNAFTVPGRRIVVSDRLLQFADTPDELAGVIAHEMGHAIEIHPESSLVRSIGLSLALELMMGGAPDILRNGAEYILQMSYSRRAERQADDWALRLLKAAGISKTGFSAFFVKLQKQMGSDEGKLGEMLSTHPATQARIDHIRHIAAWPATPALPDEDWKALKAICQ